MVRGLARGGTPLGSVLGPGQRTLLYHLLTRVHNGDRIALRKLDKSVRATSPIELVMRRWMRPSRALLCMSWWENSQGATTVGATL